jgi:hypothetical protein
VGLAFLTLLLDRLVVNQVTLRSPQNENRRESVNEKGSGTETETEIVEDSKKMLSGELRRMPRKLDGPRKEQKRSNWPRI